MTPTHSEDLELLERLGGSGATVHRAVVRVTGRVVIAKCATWDRPDVAARLGREADVLARVQHPSLVQLLGTMEDDRGRTLVLKHAPGGSLAHRVQHHGPLTSATTADTGGRLARALAALHRAGVVHRDVHPGNVLVDAELQPVLADLDSALDHAGEHLASDNDVVGEPTHVDHRLLAGATPGPASDLHGLATTLWVAATGSPPPRRAARDAVRLPTSHPQVPAPLLELLRACVAGDAGDAATVAARLEALAIQLAEAPTPVPRATPPRSRHGTAAAIVPTATDVEPAPRHGPTRAAPRPEAGGRDGGAHPVTRRWGPAPRPLPTRRDERRRRGPRPVVAAHVALTLLVVWWWASAGDPPLATPTRLAAAVPPTPCMAGAPDTTAARGRATGTTGGITLADLDGNGCSEALEFVDGELRTPTERYRLGRPDDVLLAGDWDGDGRWGVGLYRPATGAVYLFDTGPGPGARSRPAEQHPADGTPRVVLAPDGSHRVHVSREPSPSRG